MPDDIALLISHLIYDPDCWGECVTVPDHPLFKEERWENLFMHSAWHSPPRFIRVKSGYYVLELHCEINYGVGEVKEFCKWIAPYVAGRKKKQYIGWWKPEDFRDKINEYVER